MYRLSSNFPNFWWSSRKRHFGLQADGPTLCDIWWKTPMWTWKPWTLEAGDGWIIPDGRDSLRIRFCLRFQRCGHCSAERIPQLGRERTAGQLLPRHSEIFKACCISFLYNIYIHICRKKLRCRGHSELPQGLRGIEIDRDPQGQRDPQQPSFCEDRGLEYTWRGAVIGGDLDRINEFLENGQDIEERTGYLIYLGCGKHFPSNDSSFG